LTKKNQDEENIMFDFSTFSRNQWLTIAVFVLAEFCSAVCVSLQAPFYPQEAEAKGATATEYGLVFGVFELTVFVTSPLLGKNLRKLGAKRVFNLGILTTGTCSVLFGVLDRIPNGTVFMVISIVVRSVEAVGNSGFLTAIFSMIAKEFPDRVATMFATLEAFFGVGLIFGPSIGGILYQVGGYTLPFVVLGSILICVACTTFFVLPDTYNDKCSGDGTGDCDPSEKKGLIDALKVPTISIAAYSIICAAISIGFIQATLEPHLRQFNLSPIMMGLMFVVNGGVYAASAPLWGYACDKLRLPGKLVTAIGAFLIAGSFVFIGPIRIMPFPTTYEVCIASLAIHGVGFAASLVAGFSVAHHEAIVCGFPDNLDTYALISGLWTSAFALGAFIGPTFAGILVDALSFKDASLLVIAAELSVLALSLVYFGYKAAQDRRRKNKGYAEIGAGSEEEASSESSNAEYSIMRGSGGGSSSRQLSRQPSLGYETGETSSGSEEERSAAGGLLVIRSSRLGIGGGSKRNSSSSIFSPMASPLTGMTAGMTGVSVAVECSGQQQQQRHLGVAPRRGARVLPASSLSSQGRKRSAKSEGQGDDPSTAITVTAIIENGPTPVRANLHEL